MTRDLFGLNKLTGYQRKFPQLLEVLNKLWLVYIFVDKETAIAVYNSSIQPIFITVILSVIIYLYHRQIGCRNYKILVLVVLFV